MHGVRTTEGWVRELHGRCLGYIYRSTCWTVQRLTFRGLASSLCLTRFDSSPLTCTSGRSERLGPCSSSATTHRELELAGGRRDVEVFRQRPELHSRSVQTLDHLQPAGKPCERRR